MSAAETVYTIEADSAIGVPMISPPAHQKCKHTQKVESSERKAQPPRNSRVPQTERYVHASKERLADKIRTLEYVIFPYAPWLAAVSTLDELATPIVLTADVLVQAVQPPILTVTFTRAIVT